VKRLAGKLTRVLNLRLSSVVRVGGRSQEEQQNAEGKGGGRSEKKGSDVLESEAGRISERGLRSFVAIRGRGEGCGRCNGASCGARRETGKTNAAPPGAGGGGGPVTGKGKLGSGRVSVFKGVHLQGGI